MCSYLFILVHTLLKIKIYSDWMLNCEKGTGPAVSSCSDKIERFLSHIIRSGFLEDFHIPSSGGRMDQKGTMEMVNELEVEMMQDMFKRFDIPPSSFPSYRIGRQDDGRVPAEVHQPHLP